jgi:hypothetical protein
VDDNAPPAASDPSLLSLCAFLISGNLIRSLPLDGLLTQGRSVLSPF